jgi:hypothetical protein
MLVLFPSSGETGYEGTLERAGLGVTLLMRIWEVLNSNLSLALAILWLSSNPPG